MSLTLEEIHEKHEKAYTYNQITRERAADDMLFAWITQYDDSLLSDTQLSYRGEFNIIRKAFRQIIAELDANPIQVTFEPKADSRDDGADLIDGLYLSDDRVNTTLESYETASTEAVVCGVGGWEMYTEYESNRSGNKNQVIKRKPINEFNNNCFIDPNAKRIDKSDMTYCSILEPYSVDGYKALYKELTDEETDVIASNFAYPEQSYTFPWASAGKNPVIYIVSFYHKELVKDKVLTMTDPMGQEVTYRESDLDLIMDELIDDGYEVIDTKEIKRWEVTKYIASGERILSEDVIAGENIPVMPVYGERAFVESEEHYEGITRLAKDPQRLRNFQLSYLADIVSRSPRPKPIFFPEQIQGHTDMYEDNGADNNYPYYYQNMKTATGEALPAGPVAVMPEQTVPTALIQSINLSREAVNDVAGADIPNDMEDVDLSGKALMVLEKKLDRQSAIYQKHLKFAKRRDAEVYASMAADIYDAPREVTLTLADGTTSKVSVMETTLDEETGEMVVLNDLTNTEFDVFAEIGPSYSSKREETLEKLGDMADKMAASDPNMAMMINLQRLTLFDGVAMDDIREYANKQLILRGFKEPETDEEIAMMEQAAQQQEEPDAMTIAAMAEMKKGDAAIAETQRKARADQYKDQNDQADNQVDIFKAQTDRAAVQVKAQEVGANIQFTQVKTQGQQIDNVQKITAPLRARVN